MIRVGSDVLPLLANIFSAECERSIPAPPENYVSHPHKGGVQLKQPPDEDELFEQKMREWEKEEKEEKEQQQLSSKNETDDNQSCPIKPIKLIRKIWKK